jgi:nucleotide-binding universal stress UspA family protein
MSGAVVVGLDGSPAAARALSWGWDLARTSGRRLRVVHTWRGDPAQVYVPVADLRLQEAAAERAEAEQWMSAAGLSTPAPREWGLEILEGAAGPTLVAVAAQEDDCIIVVGTHEHRGLGRVLHGSVSHYVLSHAHCPVVAVPAPEPQPMVTFVDPSAEPVELPDVPRF